MQQHDTNITGTCLNCETALVGKFCHSCGQKSSSVRITFSKFISHDLMHGVFHVEKGILYTLKCLLLSPGYAVRSFLSGKRVRHYNIFALFIIVIALKTVLDAGTSDQAIFESVNSASADNKINSALNHYYKFFYFLIIPAFSIFSFLLFKRLGYYYSEHLVLNCFIFTGGHFYALFFSLVGYLTQNYDFNHYGLVAVMVYVTIGFYQATRNEYSLFGFLWRTLLALALFLLLLLLTLAAIIGIFYDGGFEGTIGV